MADLRAATPTAAAELSVPNIADLKQFISGAEKSLLELMQRHLRTHQQSLDLLSKRLQHPGQKIKMAQEKLLALNKALISLITNKLAFFRHQLASTARMLHAVSPLNTLDRGYAIIKNPLNNDIITSSQQLTIGAQIEVTLRHGTAIAKIIKLDN